MINTKVRLFQNWLRSKKQTPYIYHMGFLGLDRWLVSLKGATKNPQNDNLARRVWREYKKGKINLVQEKVDGVYFYIAQKKGS